MNITTHNKGEGYAAITKHRVGIFRNNRNHDRSASVFNLAGYVSNDIRPTRIDYAKADARIAQLKLTELKTPGDVTRQRINPFQENTHA